MLSGPGRFVELIISGTSSGRLSDRDAGTQPTSMYTLIETEFLQLLHLLKGTDVIYNRISDRIIKTDVRYVLSTVSTWIIESKTQVTYFCIFFHKNVMYCKKVLTNLLQKS